jgi:transposase
VCPPDSDLKWEIYSRKEGHYGKVSKFTPEYRDEAVKMVIETGRPIAVVARDLGINAGTLGNWVLKYRNEHPASEDLDISERARLKELEQENRELRMERDFLKKAAAFVCAERKGTAVVGR